MLTKNRLIDLCRRGQVDTVLLAFPDMLGRLLGKRITGRFFADSAAAHGVHACAYLLTVDMEMEPVQGYELTSWDKGYGDFHMVPDYGTARILPWLPKTALVLCDLATEEGETVPVSPRQILKAQVARAAKKGYRFQVGSELELFLYKDTNDEARGKGYHNLEPLGRYIEDYVLQQGTKEEFVVREIRNMLDAAGVPIEGSKGEWGHGQQEINLRHTDPLEMADRHVIYKHGAKEISWQKGVSATFMAKPSSSQAGSSFHLHASVCDKNLKRNLLWDDRKGAPSPFFGSSMAGSLAMARDFSLFFAPTVNSYKRYVASSFAPTRLAWGRDNRTTGFRVVGHGASYRIENRVPGADANPYLAFAATIAAFLHGEEKGLKTPPEFKGDAYHAKGLAEVPKSLSEAARCWEASAAAKAAFGETVHKHYLRAARWELECFERAVTCWELQRYFERI